MIAHFLDISRFGLQGLQYEISRQAGTARCMFFPAYIVGMCQEGWTIVLFQSTNNACLFALSKTRRNSIFSRADPLNEVRLWCCFQRYSNACTNQWTRYVEVQKRNLFRKKLLIQKQCVGDKIWTRAFLCVMLAFHLVCWIEFTKWNQLAGLMLKSVQRQCKAQFHQTFKRDQVFSSLLICNEMFNPQYVWRQSDRTQWLLFKPCWSNSILFNRSLLILLKSRRLNVVTGSS